MYSVITGNNLIKSRTCFKISFCVFSGLVTVILRLLIEFEGEYKVLTCFKRRLDELKMKVKIVGQQRNY